MGTSLVLDRISGSGVLRATRLSFPQPSGCAVPGDAPAGRIHLKRTSVGHAAGSRIALTILCGAVFGVAAPGVLAQASHARVAAVHASEQDVSRRAELSPELQGDLLMVRKRYLAAIEAYMQAPQSSAVVWNKVGIANHHLMNFAEARRDYEHALKLNPNYPEAMNNLGTVFYSQKNYKAAERWYKKALKVAPRSATTYSNLGTAYFAQRKYKKGSETYQKAFSIDPNVFANGNNERIEGAASTQDRASLNFCLAETFAQAGMHDRALEFLRQAISQGFKDRKKLMEDKELASLRATPQFQELLVQENIH
jgi:tetratricopeptide (TPR) repeat protein